MTDIYMVYLCARCGVYLKRTGCYSLDLSRKLNRAPCMVASRVGCRDASDAEDY
eukprot:COSAG05_NODE_1286_length_5278_cov_4.428461_7_plen_54_part_00